jgi:SapC
VTQHVLLNNRDHRELRVITTRSAAYGDDVMCTPTFPAEFRNVQAHYPIVFARGRDGSFTPLALFGFREKQNLFLTPEGWDALYLPMMIERQPFLIGSSGEGKVVHIDLDSPRVSRTTGERLFFEHGGNSDHLERAGSLLAAIDEGIAAIPPFSAALAEHDLLESFALDIEFRDGAQHRFAGFYAVQEERLNALGTDALGKLHQRGYLEAIYMVIASFANFRELIERAGKLNAANR